MDDYVQKYVDAVFLTWSLAGVEGRAEAQLLGRRGAAPARGSHDGRCSAGEVAGGTPSMRNFEGAAEGTQAAPRGIATVAGRPAGQLHERIQATGAIRVCMSGRGALPMEGTPGMRIPVGGRRAGAGNPFGRRPALQGSC